MKEKTGSKDSDRYYGYEVNGEGEGIIYVDPADLARSSKVRKHIEALRRISIEPRKGH